MFAVKEELVIQLVGVDRFILDCINFIFFIFVTLGVPSEPTATNYSVQSLTANSSTVAVTVQWDPVDGVDNYTVTMHLTSNSASLYVNLLFM